MGPGKVVSMQNIRTITTRPSGGRLFFHGRAGTLFAFYVVNLFLTIITLGVYYFWARVKIRAYLLSQTEFDGDRFTWHGTGKELLVGFIKIAAGRTALRSCVMLFDGQITTSAAPGN